LGVIMTNTEIFHIFPIISQFSSVFSKSYHYSTWVCSLFFISFHNSTRVSSIFFISCHYSTYLSSIFSRSFHYYTPHNKVVVGYTGFTMSVRLSVCQSVCRQILCRT
jgi:hypothetical protein